MNPWLMLCGGVLVLDLIALAWLAFEAHRAPLNPDEP